MPLTHIFRMVMSLVALHILLSYSLRIICSKIQFNNQNKNIYILGNRVTIDDNNVFLKQNDEGTERDL